MRTLLLVLLLLDAVSAAIAGEVLVPGDNRSGYERTDFVTDSRSLEQLQTRSAALQQLATAPPLGLPPLPGGVPGQAAIDLGRRLFFDRRLSMNGTLSCAMCHIPEQGFAQNELATPVGIEGRTVRRNAPSLYNVAYRASLFHDGRATDLAEQVWFPLLAADEMGNLDAQQVVRRINAIPGYAQQFEQALGTGVSPDALGQALASYQRALLSADSPFDRWQFAADQGALDADAKRGYAVFVRSGCSGCHLVQKNHALFSDDLFHDTGIGYLESLESTPIRSVQIAPGVMIEIDGEVERTAQVDLGRLEVTSAAADRWRYRTPSLRNVALTRPYMHNGTLADLPAVIAYYNAGGAPHTGQDPRVRPLNLNLQDQRELLAFLKALTGSNAVALAEDARTAIIGDP